LELNEATKRGSKESSSKNNEKKKKTYGDGKNKKNKGNANEVFRADRVLSVRMGVGRSEAFNLIQERRVAIVTEQPILEGEEDVGIVSTSTTIDGNDDKTAIIESTNEDHAEVKINRIFTSIRSPKLQITMDENLWMDGKPIPKLPSILMAFHKEKYILSAMDEKHSTKKHLGMFLSPLLQKAGMHPVGRLDYDSSGLLLFSRDGSITQRLLHPKFMIEKEYVATVLGGEIDISDLKKKLQEEGVQTSEGKHFGNVLDVVELGDEESSFIINQRREGPEIGKDDDSEEWFHTSVEEQEALMDEDAILSNIRLTVQEWKYRMVRRMLANCGYPVIELKRERHGEIELGDLKEGQFRECTKAEVEWATSLIKNNSKKKKRR